MQLSPNSFAKRYALWFWRPSVNDWRFPDEKGWTAKSGLRAELSGISRRVDTAGAGKFLARLVNTRARAGR